jgi:hypothetical protein
VNLKGEDRTRAILAPLGYPHASHEKRAGKCSVEALLVVLALADAITVRLWSVIAAFVTANHDFLLVRNLD